MLHWFYVAVHLLAEAGAARRDARIRFLKAKVDILRRKLGGNRVIPSPDDRARLLAIGQELDHICKSYVRFHNEHRPHQGLGNRTVPAAATGPPEELPSEVVPDVGTIRCRPVLGGLLRHYYRDAA